MAGEATGQTEGSIHLWAAGARPCLNGALETR